MSNVTDVLVSVPFVMYVCISIPYLNIFFNFLSKCLFNLFAIPHIGVFGYLVLILLSALSSYFIIVSPPALLEYLFTTLNLTAFECLLIIISTLPMLFYISIIPFFLSWFTSSSPVLQLFWAFSSLSLFLLCWGISLSPPSLLHCSINSS